MTLQELEAVVKKEMLLNDDGIIKLLCASIIASRMPVSPPWLFIVGASSGGKSMLLTSIEKIKGIYKLDELTENTFFSGYQGNDQAALIDQLLPRSTLIFKDFTTILSKDKESRKQIIGQFRKIHDGDFTKQFGTGKKISWQGQLSLIAAVTSTIYEMMYALADMGERFLMYTFEQPGRIDLTMKAMEHLDAKPGEKERQEAFGKFIGQFKIPDDPEKINAMVDEKTKMEIAELSEFTTRARSKVDRDRYSRTKDITQIHLTEMPGRFAKQLLSLAIGFIVLNDGKLLETDKKILYKIALDSIPIKLRIALQKLTKHEWVETAGLAVTAKYPVDTVRTWLQDLSALKVIDWDKKANNRDVWQLKPKYRALMAKYEGIETTSTILTELDAEKMLGVAHENEDGEIVEEIGIDDEMEGMGEVNA